MNRHQNLRWGPGRAALPGHQRAPDPHHHQIPATLAAHPTIGGKRLADGEGSSSVGEGNSQRRKGLWQGSPPAGRRIAVDLQEKHELDLAKQVANVKARARPWRAIIFSVLAVIAAAVSYAFSRHTDSLFTPGHLASSIAAASAAAAFFIFATLAVVSLARSAREMLQSVTGSAHAAVVRYAIVLIGAILTVAITLALLKVPVGQLLVGGAFATIIITIAGQQSLSNIFAGLVLLLSRPFQVGDAILLRSGALSGQLEGTVTEIGITYLRLDTGNGLVLLPNSQVLGAAVTRQAPEPRPGGPEQDE
jgi:small-conductance mechanosensitive channel